SDPEQEGPAHTKQAAVDWNPGSVDEAMARFTARSSEIVTIPGKPIASGYKTDDALGFYQYPVQVSLALPEMTDNLAEAVVNHIAKTKDAWSTWTTTGNLIVNGMFTWLIDGVVIEGKHEPGIEDLINEEFNMYLFHQREVNGEPNRGWLRIMYYGLTQQIIRQDLGNWLLYAALRPDRDLKLVSYPYHANYTQKEDSTAFRHIDLNIPQYLATGRGGNIIQGSVSLDNESEKTGCTELIPGFHQHIKTWWQQVHGIEEQDELSVGGLIQDVGKMWTREHSRRFGEFVPFPCKAGGVRITRPDILHGSTASSMAEDGSKRRTVLPWMVGVQADYETLDNIDSESWSELNRCHSAQEIPMATPSGFKNKYRPPYKFQASTSLQASSSVGRALVCEVSWKDPSVVFEARRLLGENRDKAWEIVQESRAAALRAFRKAYNGAKRDGNGQLC
ncbi:hypothetical protein MMC07_006371, partial [Pseudocyphellaria aurata]|nr:hypothetical protein [Pseudocyphellaria aurata]